MLESFTLIGVNFGGENLGDAAQSNPEIFTIKENVPVAQPPVTSEEVLTLPANELLARLDTSPQGLSSEEAERRINIYGTNELARKMKRSGIVSFLLHFKSPLILILLAAAAFAGATGDIPDFTIIFRHRINQCHHRPLPGVKS